MIDGCSLSSLEEVVVESSVDFTLSSAWLSRYNIIDIYVGQTQDFREGAARYGPPKAVLYRDPGENFLN